MKDNAMPYPWVPGMTFGMLGGGDQPQPTLPLPLPSSLMPASYDAHRLFGRAFPTLSPDAQALLSQRQQPAWLSAQDNMPPGGRATDTGLSVQFPSLRPGFSLPWRGDTATQFTADDVARHEMLHGVLGEIQRRSPQWAGRISEAIRARGLADPGFRRQAEQGHDRIPAMFQEEDPSNMSSSDVLRTYAAAKADAERSIGSGGAGEYLASLMEHGGRPVRVPAWGHDRGYDPVAHLIQMLTP